MTVRCQNELCVYWAQGACSHQAIRIDGEGTCMTFALAPVKPLPFVPRHRDQSTAAERSPSPGEDQPK